MPSESESLALIVQIWHIFFGVLGSILNLSLVLLAIFKSPKIIRLYSTFIVNFAVTDLFACLLDMFIEIRLLPSPNEATMTYILNGFCTNFGLTTCTIGLTSALFALLHMTLPVTPVYITIFILRRRIIKTLLTSHNSMSKGTKAVHAQLLKALTCQADVMQGVGGFRSRQQKSN
ncbi:unnamed protein product [Caenorhabditis sp. 36 PRJEB53466]|nr:unnamed protein product [Caenorhabditis sp. 36 PRJEB53466]